MVSSKVNITLLYMCKIVVLIEVHIACVYFIIYRIDTNILAVKLKMINQDRMIFGDFSVNFKPIFLKFSIKILTRVKISQNNIYYFKNWTICHVIKF